jgi:hypothetical protein
LSPPIIEENHTSVWGGNPGPLSHRKKKDDLPPTAGVEHNQEFTIVVGIFARKTMKPR